MNLCSRSGVGPFLVVLLVLGALACARDAAPPPGDESTARGERGFHLRGSPAYRARATPRPFPEPPAWALGWDAERLWSRHVDWEPVVGVDPATPDVYQLTTRYYAPECPLCPDPTIVFRRSRDGGATWDADGYLSRQGQGLADPQVAVALDGTLYAAYLQDFVPGAVLVKSTDRGESWSQPLAAIGDGPPAWSDKPIIAISADGQDVYLAFNASDSYVVASHDFGQTFSAPVRTNNDSRYWFHTDGGVAADGTVYFAATDYSQSLAGDAHVSILRSADGGESWSTISIDTSAEAPRCGWWAAGCYLGFLGPSAALAVDAAGRLMLAYNAGTVDGQPQTLWARASDNGHDWGPRQRISPAKSRVNSAFPALEPGPLPGDFRLVWQDDRKTARPKPTNEDRRWNTWFRRTTDGGSRWSPPIRLSRGGARTLYKNRRGYQFPYGDYLWLAVDAEGTNHVVWGAGESYDGNGGTWYTRGE